MKYFAQRGSGDQIVADAGDTEILRRMIATPPTMTSVSGNGRDTAAIPRPLPRIPGIDHLEPIGRGGMGVVFRGVETRLGRTVAVKVLAAWASLSESARRRAKREALVLAQIYHPNVVNIHSAGESEGVPYIVMEWVNGSSLQRRIVDGPLSPHEAATIAIQLARALQRVHALGVIHRDIKPDNVLIAVSDHGCHTPKLADFGLAWSGDVSQHLTQAEEVVGTPSYMAAEQTGLERSLAKPGPATDIHGLGGVLFAMLTTRAPYEAATVIESMQRSLRGEFVQTLELKRLPADLRRIVFRCLEPAPDRRYRSAGELADDLQRFLDGRPVLARPILPPERLAKWARRRPVPATLAAVAVFAVVAGLGGIAYHVRSLEVANLAIRQSHNRVAVALEFAKRSMNRLSGAEIERMLLRGGAVDAGDRKFLLQLAEELRNWPQGDEPVKALWFRCRGLARLADLLFDVGQYADSIHCREAQLSVLAELDDLLPASEQVLRQQLNTHSMMQFTLQQLNRTDEAIASIERSIALLEQSDAQLPDREWKIIDQQNYLAGFLNENGRYEEGDALLAKVFGGLRSLRARRPDEIDLAVREAQAAYMAQLSVANRGLDQEWRRNVGRLVAIGEEAIKQFADHWQSREQRSSLLRLLSIGLGMQSQIALDDGDMARAGGIAERRRKVCLDFLNSLEAGLIDGVHLEFVEADLQISGLLLREGRLSEAKAVTREAEGVAEVLWSGQSAVWDLARLRARVLHRKAELAMAEGDTATAMADFDREIELLEPWIAFDGRANDAAAFLAEARRQRQALPNAR
jgi:tetratricopeptide (TPR) repeat protein